MNQIPHLHTDNPSLLNLFHECGSVCIDSRKVSTGCLFFAIKGETTDGHYFVHDALSNGAAYAVVDDATFQSHPQCILVDNTLLALQCLAKEYRLSLTDTQFIAIVGSNGKTTTKELVTRVLQSQFETIGTIGNLNNHIGVPLTLLSLTKSTQFAVIELGANHPGEHRQLCNIVQPEFGIITNCGKDHLEGYGSIDGVINANAELYDYLNQNQGIGFINISDKTLATLSENYSFNQIRYATDQNPLPNTFIHGFCAQKYPTIHVSIPEETHSTPTIIKSHLLGDFQVNNIVAAACIGRYFSVPLHQIQAALESYIPSNNRSQVFHWKGNTVLLDAYNANPSSMSAMLHYFSDYPAEKKTIILGDMFELGNSAADEHEKIVSQVKSGGFDSVILVGAHFEAFKDTLRCTHCHNVSELKHFLDSNPYENHTFLVKGSRGMRLESAFKTRRNAN